MTTWTVDESLTWADTRSRTDDVPPPTGDQLALATLSRALRAAAAELASMRTCFEAADRERSELRADAERFRWLAERTAATGLARWVHPFQFLADAVDARRGVSRPPTPVGWSDTDWLKHLEEIRQNEAVYARGPLPERGWD